MLGRLSSSHVLLASDMGDVLTKTLIGNDVTVKVPHPIASVGVAPFMVLNV